MSVVVNDKQGIQPTEVESTDRSFLQTILFPLDEKGNPKIPWAAAIGMTVGLSIFVLAYRWYTEKYSFTVGLDYFEPDFAKYWMSLFWVQVISLSALLFIGAPWCWFTRPKDPYEMTPQKELGVYYLIMTFMTVGTLALMVVLGLFVEADAAWHQTTIRDTDFTPTHIGLFYLVIPAGAVGAIIGAIWLHTRMPDFIGRLSVPFFIVAMAPLLIMPNLGLNEWGHTFFYAEELFAAPIHWGFVVLGWGLFAFGGLLLQILNRVRVLTTTDWQEVVEAAEAKS